MASAGHLPNRKTSRRRDPASPTPAADPGDPVLPPGSPPSRARLMSLVLSSVLLILWIGYLAMLALGER